MFGTHTKHTLWTLETFHRLHQWWFAVGIFFIWPIHGYLWWFTSDRVFVYSFFVCLCMCMWSEFVIVLFKICVDCHLASFSFCFKICETRCFDFLVCFLLLSNCPMKNDLIVISKNKNEICNNSDNHCIVKDWQWLRMMMMMMVWIYYFFSYFLFHLNECWVSNKLEMFILFTCLFV